MSVEIKPEYFSAGGPSPFNAVRDDVKLDNSKSEVEPAQEKADTTSDPAHDGRYFVE